MTETSKEANLERVPCIRYPVRLRKDQDEVEALIDSGSEVNAMHPAYAAKLGLRVRETDVGAQKIDGSHLDTFGMVIAGFSVEDKLGKVRFFQETFLLANISLEVVLGMPFLTLSSVDIRFPERELAWRTYTAAEALPTTRRVEIIDKEEFAETVLGGDDEAYVVHVMAVSKPSSMPIHASRQAQVASLVSEEANIPVEYSDFSDVFSPDSAAELPEHTGFNDHPIDLVDGKQPPYGPIYSLGPMELETLKTYIETNLASGFIRPSQSPAGAPILFIRKKDGSLRLCVDYRGLNTLTIKNRYPLPLIGESLDRLGRAKRFTQLDLTNAYHRMRIREGDEWKTAFRTRYGHFEYQVMPFGLSNAPASFQGYINKILAEKLDVFVIVYLDDILIYTEDVGQGHVEAVKWVLENLRKNGLFANLKKCRFHQDEVRFLGYVVSGQGIRMEEERIEAVTNWPEPKSVRDVQVFMGFANFYRRFIRGFSKIAAPLTSMLKTNLVANTGPSPKARCGEEECCFLTPAAKLAFAQLKQAFTEAPILRHFDPERHIRLETDASGYAIGGVLSQLDIETGQWHPVAYFSRKMIPAETRYETHDGELLAIVEAFKNWRHYLEGCKHEVLVLTDHNNLRRFMDTKSLSPRQVRWAQELSRYNFRIDYRQGKANGAADALSRYPQRSQGEEEVLRAENTRILHRLQSSLTSASISGITSTQHLTPPHHIIICGTHVFPQLRQFWDTLRQDLTSEGPYKVSIGGMRLRLQELQEEDTQAQTIRAEKLGKDGWEDTEGILHYQSLPYVPEILRTELISRHHDDPLAGHFGIEKTRELIARKYFWETLRRDVESYVKGCDVCLSSKAVRHKPYGDLQSLPVPTHRWKDLSMDFVTGLPESADWKRDSYDSILVIVDRLTKMVHYEPVLTTITAPLLAEVIIDVVVRHHGLPDSIVSDRGSVFTSKFWSSLCYFLGIKRRLSTAFHPQTDGQTERQNSTMEAYLRAFVNYEQDDWARLLPMAEFAYNNAKNASTGHTPFELNCGYHPRVSYEEDIDPRSRSKSANELAAELKDLMAICKENLQHAQEWQTKAHNKGTKPRSYAPGDKVWLNSKYIKTKRNRKLEAKFFGPFRVLQPMGKQAYKLELPKRWRIHDVFHVSLLEQDTTRKGRVDEKIAEQLEFEAGNDEEYEVEGILDSAVYAKESEAGHLPGLYYLVSWKGYPEDESTWEPAAAIKHLRKIVKAYHEGNPTKPTATSPPIDTAPPMAKPAVKPQGKRKRGRQATSTGSKKAKK